MMLGFIVNLVRNIFLYSPIFQLQLYAIIIVDNISEGMVPLTWPLSACSLWRNRCLLIWGLMPSLATHFLMGLIWTSFPPYLQYSSYPGIPPSTSPWKFSPLFSRVGYIFSYVLYIPLSLLLHFGGIQRPVISWEGIHDR